MSRALERVALAIAAGVFGGLLAGLVGSAVFPAPAPTPQPRETPRVWELPSGNGVCVILGDTPIGCYQKGTAP